MPALPYPAASESLRELGRRLFFERRLSFNNAMSCAICHVPEEGFGTHTSRTAVGLEGHLLPRNAPTLLNIAWRPRLFHDGRESSLADQAWLPLLNPLEMGNPSISHVLEMLGADPEYQKAFQAIFGSKQPTMSQVGEALQAFERSLVAAGSRFDLWKYRGQASALTPVERTGFDLFQGKALCSSCHVVGKDDAVFTDDRYHVTGAFLREASPAAAGSSSDEMATSPVEIELAAFVQAVRSDLGRYEITMDPADRYAFRTASLRNVELTAPYMHDGSLLTLEAVVEYYDRGGDAVPNKSPLIRPLHLTAEERAALVAFLKTLSSPAAAALPTRLRAIP
ncbi:cytochrome c peroxidase [Panacagrimonas perspica]|uniref:Cytochrome c peroxidase n=1 Tax=Panacagrimonas perspica TaxID=381431 RepID=A0A4R7NZZ2_9GAMM|nr:cytochrome c peroxidase [Panacagrimonas perspica]TDU26499.1 cytochrome c peroxidase [Panacagrimonas perspica]